MPSGNRPQQQRRLTTAQFRALLAAYKKLDILKHKILDLVHQLRELEILEIEFERTEYYGEDYYPVNLLGERIVTTGAAARSFQQATPAVRQALIDAARETGVDLGLLIAIAQRESSFDPNAHPPAGSGSSAAGLMQFTDSTWSEMVSKYGNNFRPPIRLEDRYDPRASAIMGAMYAKQNQGRLATDLHRPITKNETYLAHFLGAGGAEQLLRNDPVANADVPAASLVDPKAVRSNHWVFFEKGTDRPYTYAEFMANINRTIDKNASDYNATLGNKVSEAR